MKTRIISKTINGKKIVFRIFRIEKNKSDDIFEVFFKMIHNDFSQLHNKTRWIYENAINVASSLEMNSMHLEPNQLKSFLNIIDKFRKSDSVATISSDNKYLWLK